ncbi:GUN4 domain-containing protein [Stenomitos frigidus]|nr:GUN4 domain-containing protein [Stenomitos frigidus]
MTQSLNQPGKDDVVLGGSGVIPTGAVILGGLDGVRRRLTSPLPEQRAAALPDALQYAQRGLNLVIRALGDRSPTVQQAAYELLQACTEPKVVRAVEQFYASAYYDHLQRLLAGKQWQMADQETRVVMLERYGLGVDEPLQANQLRGFPCKDLRTIDQLWMKYSQGRFGFSVQKAIWQKYDRLYWNKSDVWCAFADRVGWRTHNLLVDNHWKRHGEITFSLSAPVGHLPFLGDKFGIFTVEAIVNRLGDCQR